MLVGGPDGLPFPVDTPRGRECCIRQLQEIYNVDADFDIAMVYPPHRDMKNQEDGKWEVNYEYPRHIFPRAYVVHTRDPRIALQCGKRKLPFIYEDHCENFHEDVEDASACYLDSSSCLSIVAITENAKERLVSIGAPVEKIIVLDSGINKKTFLREEAKISKWRKFLLANSFDKVITYTGGLQYEERGIDQIIDVMKNLPKYMFAIAGGSKKDLEKFKEVIGESQLENVKIFGYVSQDLASTLQQASDVVLLTRAAGDGAAITSPLKFFEYMASGSPIVAAKIPAIADMQAHDLAIKWYEAGDSRDLALKIGLCLKDHPRQRDGYEENMNFAKNYTWEERQRRVLSSIGMAL